MRHLLSPTIRPGRDGSTENREHDHSIRGRARPGGRGVRRRCCGDTGPTPALRPLQARHLGGVRVADQFGFLRRLPAHLDSVARSAWRLLDDENLPPSVYSSGPLISATGATGSPSPGSRRLSALDCAKNAGNADHASRRCRPSSPAFHRRQLVRDFNEEGTSRLRAGGGSTSSGHTSLLAITPPSPRWPGAPAEPSLLLGRHRDPQRPPAASTSALVAHGISEWTPRRPSCAATEWRPRIGLECSSGRVTRSG